MDNSETEQLDDIHEEVKGSHAQLGAINERTRNIEKHIQSVSEDVESNKDDLDNLQSKVKRNTTIINAVTVGLGSIIIWISDKLTRINPF